MAPQVFPHGTGHRFHVLVAPPTQSQHDDPIAPKCWSKGTQVCHRMGGFEGRDNSLSPREEMKPFKSLPVRHRDIARPSRIPEKGMLGPHAWIVQARRNGVGGQIWPSASCRTYVRAPWRTPGVPADKVAACLPVGSPNPPASTPTRETLVSSLNG